MILGILKNYTRQIPKEAILTVRDVLPTAMAGIEMIKLEPGERGISFMIDVKPDNLYLTIVAKKVETINGVPALVISRTIGESIKILPDVEK